MHSRTDLSGPRMVANSVRTDERSAMSDAGKYAVCAPLLISAVSQLTLMGAAFLAIAAWLGSALPLGWRFAVAALVCYGIVSALVLTALHRHAAHRCFGFANAVTLTRGLLTALLWGFIAELLLGNALVLDTQLRWQITFAATAALLSDGLDGWAARRSGMASDFGAHFDMEVDALFLLALSMLVYATGATGAWVMASGILRYAFVLAGHAWPRLATPLFASWRRKTICVLQFTVLIVALIPLVPAVAAQTLCLGGLALLCYSFAKDLIWLAAKPQSLAHHTLGRMR